MSQEPSPWTVPTGPLQPACHQLLLLRAPLERLASVLPQGWTPMGRAGFGFCIVEYHCGHRGRLGQIALGGLLHNLSWRVPVVDGEGESALWSALRHTSSRLSRILSLGRLGSEAAQEADFRWSADALGTEVEVRCGSSLVLSVRTATTPFLQDSIFGAARDAERWLSGLGRSIPGRRLAHEFDPSRIAQGVTCLQPLWVPRFQSASLPALFPELEGDVELDSAFRLSNRRSQPVAHPHEQLWKGFALGDTTPPPESAFSFAPR
jgi:hypothetical protein